MKIKLNIFSSLCPFPDRPEVIGDPVEDVLLVVEVGGDLEGVVHAPVSKLAHNLNKRHLFEDLRSIDFLFSILQNQQEFFTF